MGGREGGGTNGGGDVADAEKMVAGGGGIVRESYWIRELAVATMAAWGVGVGRNEEGGGAIGEGLGPAGPESRRIPQQASCREYVNHTISPSDYYY